MRQLCTSLIDIVGIGVKMIVLLVAAAGGADGVGAILV